MIFRAMTKNKVTAYISSAVLLAALTPLIFIKKDVGRPIAAALMLVAAVAVSMLVKKRSTPSINKRTVTLLLGVIGVLYLAVYYMTGLRFGFYQNPYARSFLTNAGVVVSISVLIIAMEIVRKIFLAQKSILCNIFVFFSGIAVDVLISVNTVTSGNFNAFMDLVGLTLLPAATANLLYHYLSRRYGALPNTVFKLISTLYIYTLPVVSAIPDSLLAFIKLFLPILIYLFIKILFEKNNRRTAKKPSALLFAGGACAIVLMISIVMLISCQFRFGAIVIATESMTGEINKGDAVVYDSHDSDTVSVGDVIVFKKSNSVIVHRVIDIQVINGTTRYFTKGDANDTADSGFVTKNDIVGVAEFKVSYVGYPTLWIRQLFS